MSLQGARPGPTGDALAATVAAALADGDPLPGTAGFAGELDGRLVRDVLGRQPLFFERESNTSDGDDDGRRLPLWSADPRDLNAPVRLPAGHLLETGSTGASGHEAPKPRAAWRLPDPSAGDDAGTNSHGTSTADGAATDEAGAVSAVRAAVLESVRAVEETGLAVAFSGGVDSALVAAGVPDTPCYVAGFEGAHDVATAREAAETMDRDLRVVAFEHDDLERAVPEIVRATGRTNAMDVQIALPLYLVAERVAADGFDRLAVGQGADELFGGYSKVVNPAEDHRVDADTVRGARRETLLTLPNQLERDVLTIRAAGVEPVAPLLHDRVVRAALPLPESVLATDGERKIALRRAASGVLPDEVRTTEKKAVQYGSYAARELDRLARRAGFKRRMDDHVTKYVRALVDDAGVEE